MTYQANYIFSISLKNLFIRRIQTVITASLVLLSVNLFVYGQGRQSNIEAEPGDHLNNKINGDINPLLPKKEALSKNIPPSLRVKPNPREGTAPLTVQFSASATDEDGRISSLVWSFGDGSKSTKVNPRHTFNAPGKYTATLTAVDDKGATSRRNLVITVNPNKLPQIKIASPEKGEKIDGSVVTINYSTSGDLSKIGHLRFQLDEGSETQHSDLNGVFKLSKVSEGRHTLFAYLVGTDRKKIKGTEISVPFSTRLIIQPPPPEPSNVRGKIYYLDATKGKDANSGTSPKRAWKSLAKVQKMSFEPGDRILLKSGRVWSGELALRSAGTRKAPITVSAFGGREAPVIQALKAERDYVIYKNITVDHKKETGDAVRVRGAKHNVFKNMTIRNGTQDGIDGDKADSVLIENCHIHHFLGGSFKKQVDAHGIVFTDTKGITIRDTEIHHVSGDSFQTDPDRDQNLPDNILIENCHFWTGPLKRKFNSHWFARQTPGENAIDVKMVKSGWKNLRRMRITITDMVAHGFTKDGFISNRAVFNMKDKIQAVFDGVTVYDSEIAFRLRGSNGNANVTIKNAVMYDCETAIRAENDLSNLIVYNSTFGNRIRETLRFADGSGGKNSWRWRNNAFVSDIPSVASRGGNNRSADRGDFIAMTKGDYHLRTGSGLIDSGQRLSSVEFDRDSLKRLKPYDVGAYDFDASKRLQKSKVESGRAQSSPLNESIPSALKTDTYVSSSGNNKVIKSKLGREGLDESIRNSTVTMAINGLDNSAKPNSWTLYEDAEDNTTKGWHKYKAGKIRNIEGGSAGSKRAIEIIGNQKNDVFRLAKEDGSNWDNNKEFFASFSIAFQKSSPGVIYFEISTSHGTKYLIYTAGEPPPQESVDQDLIYISLGDIANSKWHLIRRNLEKDLMAQFPGTKLYLVKNLFVYGSLKLDDVILMDLGQSF